MATPRKFKMWDRVRVVEFNAPRVHPDNRPLGRIGKISSFFLWPDNIDTADPVYTVWFELKPGETREDIRYMATLVAESELELVTETS